MIGSSQPGSGTVRRPARLFGNGLNDVFPETSTTVLTTESPGAVEVQGVCPEAGDLTPAQSRPGRRRDDAPVALRHGREEPIPEVRAADDPLVGVVGTGPGRTDIIGGVEGDQPVSYGGPQHKAASARLPALATEPCRPSPVDRALSGPT